MRKYLSLFYEGWTVECQRDEETSPKLTSNGVAGAELEFSPGHGDARQLLATPTTGLSIWLPACSLAPLFVHCPCKSQGNLLKTQGKPHRPCWKPFNHILLLIKLDIFAEHGHQAPWELGLQTSPLSPPSAAHLSTTLHHTGLPAAPLNTPSCLQATRVAVPSASRLSRQDLAWLTPSQTFHPGHLPHGICKNQLLLVLLLPVYFLAFLSAAKLGKEESCLSDQPQHPAYEKTQSTSWIH